MENTTLEKNLMALNAVDPELHARVVNLLHRPQQDKNRTVFTENNELNFILAKDGKECPIHQSHPSREAAVLYEKSHLKNPRLLVIFGNGMGYLLDVAMQRANEYLEYVIVVEHSLEAFTEALRHRDLARYIDTHKILFVVGVESRLLFSFFTILLRTNALNAICFDYSVLILNSCVDHFWDYYEPAIEAFRAARDHAVRITGSSVPDAINGLRNTFRNLELISKTPTIGVLSKLFESRPAISVAAGPSLSRNMHELSKVKDRAVIICADSALAPLLKAGIRPHIVTAIERDEVVATLLDLPYPCSDICLIAPQLVHPKALVSYGGPKFLYSPAVPYYELLPIPRATLMTGVSAGNLNYSVAMYLGCSPIILCGQDLAFDLNTLQSHVSGTVDPAREKSKSLDEIRAFWAAQHAQVYPVDGLLGDKVYTHTYWDLFRQQFEMLIDLCQIPTINATEGGALIKGAVKMTLRQAMESLLPPGPESIRTMLSEIYRKSAPENTEQIIDSTVNTIAGWKPDAARSIQFLRSLTGGPRVADQFEAWWQVNRKTTFGRLINDLLLAPDIWFRRSMNSMLAKIPANQDREREVATRYNEHIRMLVEAVEEIDQLFDSVLTAHPLNHEELHARGNSKT